MSVPVNQKPPLGVVNVPDISPPDDDFTALPLRHEVRWIGLSGLPANALERRVKGLRLSRYRAALQAAMAARSGRVVISHLPLMSAAASEAMRLLRRDTPHLAFSFNFTDRPTGRRLRYFRHALSSIDQFAVYSEYEKRLYAELFGIAEDRFVPVVWTQTPPPVQADPGIDISRPYFCAIGGEGRDVELILKAARIAGRSARIVMIARPRMIAGLPLPDNVEALTDIPLARTWAIASSSLGVLVPLISEDTCCGHITMVSAKQLGLPIATTRSFATREYVEGRGSIVECEAGDAVAFAGLLERLADERVEMRSVAQTARAHELAFHDRAQWAVYVDRFLDEFAGR